MIKQQQLEGDMVSISDPSKPVAQIWFFFRNLEMWGEKDKKVSSQY